MPLDKLVNDVAQMPAGAKRKISAILGAVVADAASLPLEWIYKDEDMQDIVGSNPPEFWPSSHCPFYTLPTGSLSCYSDELVTSLSSLAASKAVLDLAALTKAIQHKFGDPDSPYQISLAKRAAKVYPVPGPWINSGVIKSLANMADGIVPPGSAVCEDNDGLAIALPAFLARLESDEGVKCAELLTTCQVAGDHLQVQQALVKAFLGHDKDPVGSVVQQLSSQLPTITDEIEAVKKAVGEGKSVKDMVGQFGKACGLPGSFQGAMAVLLVCGESFVTAVRQNILAGGDCNARALLVGACLGARLGVENIPMEWINKVHGAEQVLEDAIKVYGMSS